MGPPPSSSERIATLTLSSLDETAPRCYLAMLIVFSKITGRFRVGQSMLSGKLCAGRELRPLD